MGQFLRRKCLSKHLIKGKINRILWGTGFGRVAEPVVR